MSAIAAILNFDDKPADQILLTDLSKRLAHYGPDGEDLVTSGPVGICYRGFHTNRQSRLEQQPLVSRNGTIVVFDGRIDNRGELIAVMRSQLSSDPGVITDVEIVMAAFSRWGEDCLPHLVGDFALIVWDPAKQRMLLARDHIGARTLYYHLNEKRLICSSELEPLVDLAGISLIVNEDYVAGFLAYDPDPQLTPFNNFLAVQPFHSLSISRNGKTCERRYWSLADIKPLRYVSDGEYEEHFYELFRDSVQGPLRSDLPVFADLSGGLDSSAIVCVADQLLAAGEVSTPRVETVSQVSDSSPTSDERKFIRYVEDQRGHKSHYVNEEDYPLLQSSGIENAPITFNSLLFGAEQHRAVRDLMQASGARVLLSGVGGDEITCSNPDPSPELADLLVKGSLLQLHAGLKAWSAHLRQPYVQLLWRNVLLPVMPDRVRLKQWSAAEFPSLLARQFVERMHLRERVYLVKEPFGCASPSTRDQAAGFWTAVRGIATGHRQQLTQADLCYPFLNRPLVEFMQAIPHTQRMRIGETRSLLRRALKNVLPEKIRKRRSKGNPTELISRALERESLLLQKLFSDARVCDYGFIDSNALKSTMESFRLGCGIQAPVLLKAMVLEVWLRALEQRSAFTKQSTVTGETQIFPETVPLKASPACAR